MDVLHLPSQPLSFCPTPSTMVRVPLENVASEIEEVTRGWNVESKGQTPDGLQYKVFTDGPVVITWVYLRMSGIHTSAVSVNYRTRGGEHSFSGNYDSLAAAVEDVRKKGHSL